MDTHVLPFGQHQLALGVNWSVKTPAEAKDEAQKASAFLIRKNADGSTASFATVDEGVAKIKNLIPCGALVGVLYPEAIVMHPINDDQVWFCAISKGTPLPGMDVITTQEEAKKQVQLVARSTSGALIGQLNGATASLEQVLAMAQDRIGSKIISKKEIQDLTFQRSGLKVRSVLLAVLALAVIALVALGAMKYKSILAERKKLEAAAKRALQGEEERKKIEARLNKMQADFNDKVAEGRMALGSGSAVRQRWASCETIRRGLPVSLYGFKPEKLLCNFTTGKATVEWRPGAGYVTHADRAKLPNVTNPLEFEVAATSQWPLDKGEPEPSVEDVGMDVIRFDVGTWAATRLKGLSVAKAEEMKVSPPAELREARQVKAVVLGYKAAWNVQGSGTEFVFMLPAALAEVAKYTSEMKELEWLRPSVPERTAKASGILYSTTKQ